MPASSQKPAPVEITGPDGLRIGTGLVTLDPEDGEAALEVLQHDEAAHGIEYFFVLERGEEGSTKNVRAFPVDRFQPVGEDTLQHHWFNPDA